ncbi:MAG: hypothetical protein AAF578_00345 [Pseudomonadota bacterium]
MILLQPGGCLELQAGGCLVTQSFVARQAASGRVRKKSPRIYVEVDDKLWFFDNRAQAMAFLARIAEEVEEELEQPVSKIRVAPGRPAPIIKTNAPRAKTALKKAQKAIKRRIYSVLPQIEARRQRRVSRRRDEEALLLLI